MATAARGSNRFAIWISVAVVAAIAIVIALVVWMNNAASAPAPRPDGAGINQETGAILAGSGPNEITVYFDFYCPHCQDFEDLYGDVITEQAESGVATINYHPVALAGLNAASGTDFSKRSANAMYCVAEAAPDAALPFMQALIFTDPSGPGATDAEMIAFAAEAGATGIDDCVADRPWDKLVQEQTTSIPPNPETGGAGTPTLLINGEWIGLTGDPEADVVARMTK